MKTDASGNIQWQNTIGGSDYDHLHSVQQTTDGGYILGGASNSNISGDKTENSLGSNDFWVVKLSAEGECLPPTSLASSNITETSATVSWSDLLGSKGYVVRYKAAGSSDWLQKATIMNDLELNNLSPGINYAWNVRTRCTNLLSPWSPTQRFTTLPLKESAGVIFLPIEISLYPNPASNQVTLEINISQQQILSIKVFDVFSREVFSSEKIAVRGTFTKQLDLSHLPSGTYFLRVMHDGASEVRKMVIEK